jgi:hypothetical protein
VNEPDLFSSKPCFWIKRDLLRLGYALAHDHALIVGEIGQRARHFAGPLCAVRPIAGTSPVAVMCMLPLASASFTSAAEFEVCHADVKALLSE